MEQTEHPQRILIVDDEPAILSLAERIFEDEPVKIRTAMNGPDALRQLAAHDFAMVLADYQLPDMSGLELLRQMQSEYPMVRRVLTTAYIDEVTGLEGVARGLYAQLVPKPWDATTLRDECLRQVTMARELHDVHQLDVITAVDRLPTLPVLYHRYQEAIERNAPVDAIVDLLTDNAAVVAQILRIANSAFYGHQTISSLKSAIMTIGLNTVSHLLMTVLLVDQLDWDREQKQALQSTFIEGSLTNFAFMQLYEMHFGHAIPDDLAVVGLLSYVGRILYIQYYPERWKQIHHAQRAHQSTFHAAEQDLALQEVIAAQLGAALLAWWNVPERLVTLTLFADDPDAVEAEYRHLIELRMEAEELAVSLQSNPSGFLKKSTNGSISGVQEPFVEEFRTAMLEKYWRVKDLYT